MSLPDLYRVEGGQPYDVAPRWAELELRLMSVLDAGWRSFSDTYCEESGELRFHGRVGIGPDDRDGVDDFYEAFFNWPHLYLLGGSSDLLSASKRHWEAVTAQLTRYGLLKDEFERGYDWFHQGESLQLFYGLCIADPDDRAFADRLQRFARFFVDPAAGNYDAATNVFRASHIGSVGARIGFNEGDPYYPWNASLEPYGLPLEWIPGIQSFGELVEDPAKGRRMGEEMWARMAVGDSAVNLISTSLVALAAIATGEADYGTWITDYCRGWLDRVDKLGGIFPDNAGPSGQAGELLQGRWYGGNYGWTWPHGLHSVGAAAVIGATNATLISGDDDFLRLGARALDTSIEQAESRRPDPEEIGNLGRWAYLGERWRSEVSMLVPYRRSDRGWFEYQPVQAALPTTLWQFTAASEDAERLATLRSGASYEWADVYRFRDKEEAGHEEPWIAYLQGANRSYPEQILTDALAIAQDRQLAISDDASHGSTQDFNLWQQRNPALTEALTQLTWGAPQTLYNGGLPQARLRHHDLDRERPGLPPGVAALVSDTRPTSVTVSFVNSESTSARILVQSGTFAEHAITQVAAANAMQSGFRRYIIVELAPRSQISLSMSVSLRSFTPILRTPYAEFRSAQSMTKEQQCQ